MYSVPGPAVVAAEIAVAGERFRIRRSGRYDSSLLELDKSSGPTVRGIEAQRELEGLLLGSQRMSLASALTSSAILQQDVMKYVLESKPSERYEQLSRMMGLGVLEDFEDGVRRRAEDIAEALKDARATASALEQRRTATADRLEAVRLRVVRGPIVELARTALDALVRSHPETLKVKEVPRTAKDAGQALAEAQRLLRSLRSLLATYDEDIARANKLPPLSDLAALRSDAHAARERVSAAELRSKSAQAELTKALGASDDLSRLAALAVPLLADTCPVCGQRIEAATVRASLERRARDIASLSAAKAEVKSADDELRDAQTLAKSMAADFESAEGAQRERDRLGRTLEQHQRSLAQLFASQTLVHIPSMDVESARGLESMLDDLVGRLGDLTSAFAVLDREGEAGRLEVELKSADEAMAEHSRRVEELKRREAEAKTLASTATQARVEVVSRQFSALEPIVLDIYQRLDPHPTFKTIAIEHEVYRSHGRSSPLVRDDLTGVQGRPQLIFSSSQANVVALSYFLATGLALGNSWLPFLLLDDPLQSLDDVNILGFVDLCRLIRAKRQLLVSTHDARLARLLERKLAPRASEERTLVLNFVAWSRSGPEIESRFAEPQIEESKLRLLAG